VKGRQHKPPNHTTPPIQPPPKPDDLIRFPDRKAAREIERLRRFLTRIAASDELTGDGATEEMTGPAARELHARMAMAQRGLDGDEWP